ncbi:hypothetical protein F4779DRAFT_170731 [Xylariaceae sp. FL0662B]|nr:hypothetical protein F4779DRAFT_170731 [Xylariaceae sp. FL0662B]
MQGDIFQMEQVTSQSAQSRPMDIPTQNKKNNVPQPDIYNEDDLSHLLYVNYQQPAGHEDRVIINDVDHEGAMMLESPLVDDVHTSPPSEHGSPMFSDCESALDEDDDAYDLCHVPSHHRRNALSFEDGFQFPIFLGQQTEEARPGLRRSTPSYQLDNSAAVPRSAAVQDVGVSSPPTRVAEEHHLAAIDGPMMSWWPESLETMEHEWVVQEEKVDRGIYNTMPTHEHVSNIDGPMMTWWPEPMEMMEHEWVERFYE